MAVDTQAATEVTHFKNYIGGEWVDAISGDTFDVINPATEEVFATVPSGGREDAQRAIAAAREAFDSGVWSGIDPEERKRIMLSVVERVSALEDELATLETMQAGMTIRATSTVVIGYCVQHWDYFARQATRPAQQPLEPVTYPTHSYNFVLREPFGVCAGIIPWNFPLVMAVWKLAPALAMGNTCVLKPASNTPLTALKLAEILDDTELPKGVVNVITGGGSTVGEELASHPDVDKVAFTGSTVVGRRIMQLASSTIKKLTLELGGKSPNIVYEDADMDTGRRRRAVGDVLPPGPGLRVRHAPAAARVDPRRVRRAPGRARKADQDRRHDGLRLRPGAAGLRAAARHRGGLRAHRQGGGREARARRRAGRKATPTSGATGSSRRSSPRSTTR